MRRFATVLVVFSTLTLTAFQLNAQQTQHGNFLVANGDKITEYTRTGTLVQQIDIPSPGAFEAVARDIAVDHQGRIHVMQRPESFADGFQHYLSTLDTTTGQWEHNTRPSWSISGVTYYGGIGVNSDFVFATDHENATDDDGILRFSLNDLSSSVLFQEELFGDQSWHDVKVGLNGDLYALNRSGTLRRMDTNTFATIEDLSVSTTASVTGVAIAANGEIYTVDLDEQLNHFSSDGTLLRTVDLGVNSTNNMELNQDGTLLIGSEGNFVTMLNISDLDTRTVIDTSAQDVGFGFNINFVAFTAVPEPNSCILLPFVALTFLRRKRTSRI